MITDYKVSSGPAAIEFINVEKKYREEVSFFTGVKRKLTFNRESEKYTHALKQLNLQIEQGDFFAFLGPNGAGKSTAIGIVSGLVNKTSGKVLVNGIDIDISPYKARTHIGLVPQEFNFNIFENVLSIVENEGGYYGMPRSLIKSRSKMLLQKMNLWDKRFGRARELSGGMKRRLMIARGLIHDPDILILDEPTAGVDIEIRREMWLFLEELNKSGTTIILTTHYLEEAEALCNNVAIINNGNLMAHAPMNKFLKELSKQSFVITTDHDIPSLKQKIANAPFESYLTDSGDLVVKVDVSDSLNSVFEWLQNTQIKAMSVRPKVNRLEQLFVNLTHDSSAV